MRLNLNVFKMADIQTLNVNGTTYDISVPWGKVTSAPAFVPMKASNRMYPYLLHSYGSGYYKVSLAHQGVTNGSTQWYMISMEIVLGGTYSSGANGKIFLSYYFKKLSDNTWVADDVRGIAIGAKLSSNDAKIMYDIANPGIFYIKANNNAYNSISIQNLTANDSAPNYNYLNSTIEAVSSIPSSANKTVPISFVETTNGSDTIITGNTDTPLEVKGNGGSWIKFSDPSTNPLGYLGFTSTKSPSVYIGNTGYTMLHSGNSSVSKSGETLTVKINGTEYSLTNTNTDTNTWRTVQCNGTSIGNNTLNLKPGSNISLSNSNGAITINATDTNTWRGITDSYSGTATDTSLSQKGANDLYNALVNGSADGLNINSGSFSVPSAGWYKLAYMNTTDARGSVRLSIYTTGGNYTPKYAELKVSNGWSVVDFTQYGRFDWINAYRYTTDSSKSYIEAYFVGACDVYLSKIKGRGNVDDNNSGWVLYSTATSGSGTIAQEAAHHQYCGLYSNNTINGAGFIKIGSNDNYVLLGGGGHKAESSLSVNYANSAGSAGSASSASSVPWSGVSGKPTIFTANGQTGSDCNNIKTNGSYYVSATSTNSPGAYGEMLCMSNVDTHAQIYVPYSNSAMKFRGANNANGYYSWRTVIDDNNISSYALTSLPSHSHSYLPLSGGTLTGNLQVNGSVSLSGIQFTGGESMDTYGNFTFASGSGYWHINNSDASLLFSVWRATGNVQISNSTSDLGYKLYVGGAGYFSSNVTVVGNVSASSGFYQSSDERLKTFYDPIKVDLDKLKKLRKNYFKFNDRDELEIGISAQEIQQLYPEIVTENDEGYLSVAYDKLSVITLSAIDELHEENKQLKSENDALRKRIEAIENILNKLTISQ